jgi:predicted small secreted protein
MKISSVVIALIAVFYLSACNTVGGMGKDIQKGGQAIEKSTK